MMRMDDVRTFRHGQAQYDMNICDGNGGDGD
jgi:hypothetical protein